MEQPVAGTPLVAVTEEKPLTTENAQAVEDAHSEGPVAKVVVCGSPNDLNYWMSNWYEQPFVHKGKPYTCVEQCLMAEKARLMGDSSTRAEIMAAESPAKMKSLGRQVANYDDLGMMKRNGRGHVPKSFTKQPFRNFTHVVR